MTDEKKFLRLFESLPALLFLLLPPLAAELTSAVCWCCLCCCCCLSFFPWLCCCCCLSFFPYAVAQLLSAPLPARCLVVVYNSIGFAFNNYFFACVKSGENRFKPLTTTRTIQQQHAVVAVAVAVSATTATCGNNNTPAAQAFWPNSTVFKS